MHRTIAQIHIGKRRVQQLDGGSKPWTLACGACRRQHFVPPTRVQGAGAVCSAFERTGAFTTAFVVAARKVWAQRARASGKLGLPRPPPAPP